MMLLLHLIVLIVGYHEQGRLAVLVLMSLIAHDRECDKKDDVFAKMNYSVHIRNCKIFFETKFTSYRELYPKI